MSALDIILFLKDVSLFESLSNTQLAEVARLAEKVDYPAGHVLFNQGDPPDYLYLVRKGKLRVLINNMEVARLGAGECVGEMAVLAGTRRTGGVETLEACQLLRFAERDFLGLVDAYPELGRAILKSLVHRLAAAGRNKEQKRINTLVGMVWGKDGPAADGSAPAAAPRPARPEAGALSGSNFPRVSLANSGTNFPRVQRPAPTEPASNRSPSRASPSRPLGEGSPASTRSPASPPSSSQSGPPSGNKGGTGSGTTGSGGSAPAGEGKE